MGATCERIEAVREARSADSRRRRGSAPRGSRLLGLDWRWVVEAEVMPAVTSTNTNAPMIMIV
jgi:hypothetical protein